MGTVTAFASANRPIEDVVSALDALADPTAADAARLLVQRVLELHGLALSRMLETIAEHPGSALLTARLIDDERVSGVLLLHGLHPVDFETRVRVALDRLHAHLGVQGVAIQSVAIEGDKLTLKVGLSDAGRYDSGSANAIGREIREALMEAAPDASSVEIELVAAQVFRVPVSSITTKRPARDSADASQ
jgi:DNA-binding transcriptional ArsR family regulator